MATKDLDPPGRRLSFAADCARLPRSSRVHTADAPGAGRQSMSTTETLQAPVAVPADDPARPPLVSVVIPCLNESETIAECVTRARHALHSSDLHGEVIVADNGSRGGPP